MSSLVHRLKAFLQSPRGRQMVDRGRRELAKPNNQQRLRQFMARFKGRR